MTNRAKTFFEGLTGRGHVPWLEQEHGRLRFEIVDEESVQLWTVAFDDGDVRLDRETLQADGVVRVDHALFDRMVTGEEKLLPAALRGEFILDGSLELIVQFSKLLPGPAGQTGPESVGDAPGRVV